MADAFIQLVKTITAPVVFLTVVVGIAALGDMARAGRLALRALGYFFVMTVIALALGLTAGNLFKPGAGFTGAPSESGAEAAQERIAEAGARGRIGRRALGVPARPPAALELHRALRGERDPQGARDRAGHRGVSPLPTAQREAIVRVLEVAAKVVFGIIKIVMWAAPIGVFGGMAFTVAQFGGGALTNLLKLMAVFWGTAGFFVFVVLGLAAAWSGFSIFKSASSRTSS